MPGAAVLHPGGWMAGRCPHHVPPRTADDPEEGAHGERTQPAVPCREMHKGTTEAVNLSSLLVLDLSQSGLHHLEEVLKVPSLKQLHLQRNQLCTIPKDFFQLLPKLTWLDLRFNRIKALPSGIGLHKHLRTLLLERNPITALPVELGLVSTLRALNLRHCPLEFPPQPVLQKGLAAILAFLQVQARENTCPRTSTSKDPSTVQRTHMQEPSNLPGKPASSEEILGSWEPQDPLWKTKVGFLPPVQKLALRELRESQGSPEDWPDEEEIRRFWKLRQEIVAGERAQGRAGRLLQSELPPRLQAALAVTQREHSSCRHKPRKRTSFQDALPDASPLHDTEICTETVEAGRLAALRELREKQELMEQRRRDQQTLQEWREETWKRKGRKEELGRLQPPRRRMLVESKIPFATGLSRHEKGPVKPPENTKPSKEKSANACRALRPPPIRGLEQRIRQHIQQIRARRKHAGQAAPLEELQAAARDLEVARRLQDEVRKQKLGLNLNRDHQLTALTQDLSLRSPASQVQKVLSNTDCQGPEEVGGHQRQAVLTP